MAGVMEVQQYTFEEGEADIVPDDKMMCDLHLNSALNLDALRTVMGIDVGYNAFYDTKIDKSLKKGKALIRSLAEDMIIHPKGDFPTEPGMIDIKVHATCTTGMDVMWKDPFWDNCIESLNDILCRAGCKTDFTHLRQYKDVGLRLPADLKENFERIMYMCLGVSELVRGGDLPETLMAEVSRREEWLYTSLCGKEECFLMTDGTVCLGVLDGDLYVSIWLDVLALMDTLGQRISLFLSYQQARLIHQTGGTSHEVLQQSLDLFDDVLFEMQNDGYRVIGMFETLVTGLLLKKNQDGINDPMGLLSNMSKEIDELAEIPGSDLTFIRERVYSMIDLLEPLSNGELSNLFCNYRAWGHPYVNVLEGMRKIHKIGTTEKVISPRIAKIITWVFKEYVVKGFYNERGTYPEGLVSPIKEEDKLSYIERQILSSKRIESFGAGYMLDDWEDITLPALFSIPSTYDLTHILNDKAISPPISKIIESVEKGENLSKMDGRRGIISWLKGKTINCRDFLKKIAEGGIPEDELAIGLNEKERELKIEARMFALMTETMRYYFVITEGLIADHLLKYFPQITMKDSLNKLQKKLWMARTKGGNDFDVNVNIDFSKWNTNMRSDLMTPLFNEMDKLFGMKDVIGRTHDIFTKSLIYSCSGNYVPTVENGDIQQDAPMCYRGHLGGMEGLRQKGWTIGTVCLIEYIARSMGVKYKLMGQGDNQIIKLTISSKKWLLYKWTPEAMAAETRSLVDAFVDSLELTFRGAGLPVKPRECWRSHRLFMYGKAMLMDDDVLPQWGKKLLRSYALSNEGVLTLNGTIGTIAANCMSSCTTMSTVELGYSMFILMGSWTLNYLIKYHPFNRETNLNEFEVEFSIPGGKRRIKAPKTGVQAFKFILLMIPSACGGAVNIPYLSYVMRGFPDPVSEAYSYLRIWTFSKNTTFALIAKNFLSYLVPPTNDIGQLAASPLSINHHKVLAPNLSAKQEALSFIRERYAETNNVISMDIELEQLYSGINVPEELSTDPLNPVILNEMYGLFPHVISADLISRVRSTRTVKKLAIKCPGVQVINRMKIAESSFVGYLRWRATVFGEIYSECTTKHVRKMRDIGWGRKITGVTSPHPIELGVLSCTDLCECQSDTDYVYLLKRDSGGFAPYLGSTVKNKVQSSGDENVRAEPVTRSLLKMATYANWMRLGENYRKVLVDLGKLYGETKIMECIESELNAENNYSGSMDHRLRTGIISEGCFINYAPQVGGKIFMSTDNMTVYGRGNTNYTLQFQALFCWSQYMAAKHPFSHHAHYHILCDECVIPVVDEVPDIKPGREIVVPKAADSLRKMLGIEISAPIETVLKTSLLLQIMKRNMKDVRDIGQLNMLKSLTYYVGLKVAMQIMGKSLEESEEMSVGTVDLQKYPRIYSKKMYTDLLIKTVAYHCIVIAGMDKGSGLDGRALGKLKRYIIDRLSHTANSLLADLGSLTIERNYAEFMAFARVDSEGAAYPCTLNEHLRSTLQTLKQAIQQTNILPASFIPDKLSLPGLTVSSKELSLIIAMKHQIHDACSEIYVRYSRKNGEESVLMSKCPQHHISKINNDICIYNATLDKFFKQSLTCKRNLISGHVSKRDPDRDFVSIRLSNRVSKMNRFVTETPESYTEFQLIKLPTSSPYKWDEVLRCVNAPSFIILLGDGTGSTSYLVAAQHPNTTVFPMSYLEKDDLVPQDLGSLSPAMSRCLKNVSNDAILNVHDDVDHPDFVTSLKKFIEKLRSKSVWLVSDIEYKGGSILLSDNIKEICDIGVTCLFKCYAKELLENELLRNIRMEHFAVFPSTMGRTDYNETFIYIRNNNSGNHIVVSVT